MSSDVAHYAGLSYWGPISSARIESMLDLLDLRAGDQVLDVGCGRGELLVRLVERFGVVASGVDRSEAATAMAAREAARRVPEARVQLSTCDALQFAPAGRELDLISWLGGPYVGAGFPGTLRTLASWARPGGCLLVGHGFWLKDPPAEYLRETGIAAEELVSHAENISLAREAGLTLLYTGVSNRDEWDEFEGRILFNWERRLSAEAEDQDLRATVAKKRRWNDAQQRWGREVMGFGLYLLRT